MLRSFGFSFTLFLCLAPVSARAWECENLWYTRHAILDRAGMCFDTVLAQTLFDNTGCLGTAVQVDPVFSQIVNQLGDRAHRLGCRIDASQPVLNLPDLAIRQQLVELPLPHDSPGYNCIGWRGQPLALYSARSATSAPVGRIDPGDFVGLWNSPFGPDWIYAVVHTQPGGPVKSGGWMQPGLNMDQLCSAQAG